MLHTVHLNIHTQKLCKHTQHLLLSSFLNGGGGGGGGDGDMHFSAAKNFPGKNKSFYT